MAAGLSQPVVSLDVHLKRQPREPYSSCRSSSQYLQANSGRLKATSQPGQRHLGRAEESRLGRTLRGVACGASATEVQLPEIMPGGVIDFYSLLGVNDDATASEIKFAYRNLAKECHPDYLGNEGHNICILLNEGYETLSDPMRRSVYNEQLQAALIEAMDDYTGQPLSKWMAGHKMGKSSSESETRAVFVDECACVGCKQCVWLAPATYRIEPDYGRSRVFAQWLNSEDEIQDSIDSCPVDCISWVDREQLPALEYVTRFRTKRTDVAAMMSGQGGGGVDVYAVAERFLKMRERQQKERRAAARRSEQQERARQQAAHKLMQRQGGWLAQFGRNLESAFNGVRSSVDRSMDDNYDDSVPQVGKRRRRPAGAPIDEETGATIPVERSLVRRE